MTREHTDPAAAPTILLVEDEPLVRESTALLLESFGYKVLAAGSGPEAVTILHRAERLDLLLTDVVLPCGMAVLDLADSARARHPGIKVLMFSAYPRSHLIKNGEIGEDTPLVSKPFHPEALAQAIRDLWGGD